MTLSATPNFENAQRKFREAVLLSLFALLSPDQDQAALASTLMFNLKITREKVKQAFVRASTVVEASAPLIKRLSAVCLEHRWARVGKLEQAVLILGAWELEFDKSIPEKVVFAEAVRLANKFSGQKSAQFVNAVLDGFHKSTPVDTTLDWQDPQAIELSLRLEEGASVEVSSSKDSDLIQEADSDTKP